MEKNKDIAYQDWINMIQQSWTWERLTEDERTKFLEQLDNRCVRAYRSILKGTYSQRYDILNAMYSFYLDGLGYKPQGWRIPKE